MEKVRGKVFAAFFRNLGGDKFIIVTLLSFAN